METKELNSQIRSTLRGSFVELSRGVVHYEMAGPEGGEPVVLVHGFSGPLPIWDPTFPVLAEAGFRVVRYSLYGRGYSDRPPGPYNSDLFVEQIRELLSALSLTRPIHLVGLSMGGAVVTHFTSRHPDQVGKLVLLGPAGFLKLPLMTRLLRIPLIGEALSTFSGPFLQKGTRRAFSEEESFKRFFVSVQEQMTYKGFRKAVLSTLRNMTLGGMEETYRKVGRLQKPTLLIWGREDRVVPYSLHKKILECIPHLKLLTVKKGSHSPHYEKPEEVNPVLVDFLKEEGQL